MWEITIMGLSHAIFGIILVSTKEKKSKADLILILWISILMLTFLEQYIISIDSPKVNLGRFLNQSFTILNGPFLYLYIKEIIKKKDSPKFLYWPHLLLFMFFYILLVINPAPLTPGGPIGTPIKGFHIIKC